MIRARRIPHQLRDVRHYPYRLGVSPDELSTWAHSAVPVTAAGFTDVRDTHPSHLAAERLTEEIATIAKESALPLCVQAGFDLSSFGIQRTAGQDRTARARGFLSKAMPRLNAAPRLPFAARTLVDDNFDEYKEPV
jgi:hypothetical protein